MIYEVGQKSGSRNGLNAQATRAVFKRGVWN